MSHNFNDGTVLHCVKSFCKIQFENNNFSFAMVALMNVFKAPGNAVLDGSPFDKSVLVVMQKLDNNLLQSVCQDLCQQLDAAIEKRDRSEIINSLWVIYFGDQSDEGDIDALQIDNTVKKTLGKACRNLILSQASTFSGKGH